MREFFRMNTTSYRSFIDLEQFKIARSLMQQLWSYYDGGGISNGRAERSALLESVTDCTPIELRCSPADLDWLLDQAARARPVRHEFEPELFRGLNVMPLDRFTCLALEGLRLWYAQDPLKEIGPGHFLSLTEKKVFDAVERLLDIGEGARQLKRLRYMFSYEQIIKEGHNRRRLFSRVLHPGAA